MRVIRSVVAFVLALSLVVADFLQAGVTMAAAPVAAPARPSGDPAPVTPAPAPAAVVPDPTMAEVSTAGPTVFTTRLRLKTDTTWGPQGSPYVLQAGMLVDLDASLTLLPGTVVQVGAGESIVVSGQLLSLGRPDARVTITSAGAERFSAVSFQRSLLDSVRKRVSVLDYTDVSHGTGGSGVLLCTHSGMVDVRAPVYISNSSFTDSSTTALSMDQGAVTRSRFATSACGIGGARATVSVVNNHFDASLRRAASFAVSVSVRMEYNTFESMVNFHSDPTGVYFRNNTVLQDTWLNPVLGAGDGAYAGNWWGRPLKAEPWCMPLAEYDAWKLRPKPDLRGPCPSSPGMYLVGYPASYLPALSAPPPPAPEAVLDTLAPRLGPVMSATGALVLDQEDLSLSDAGRQLVVARRYRSDRAGGDAGRGWSVSYGEKLAERDGGGSTMVFPDGTGVDFREDDGVGYVAGQGTTAVLLRSDDGSTTVAAATGTTYFFDPGGTLTKVQSADPGYAVRVESAGGKTTRVVGASGRSVSYARNADGQVTGLADQAGRSVALTYTGGRLSKVTGVDGGTQTYEYDGDGRLTTVVSAEGRTQLAVGWDGSRVAWYEAAGQGRTTLAYHTLPDGSGSTTATLADGSTIVQYYDALGRVLAENRAGTGTHVVYDGGMRPIGQVTGVPSGPMTGWSALASLSVFDASGLRTLQVTPAGRWVGYSYTEAGKPQTVTYPDGTSVRYTYTGGRATSVTDRRGKTWAFTYDGFGQMTSLTDPVGNVKRSEYAANGDPVRTVDESGAVTTYAVDAVGRVSQVTGPVGAVTRTTYTPWGDVSEQTLPSGLVVSRTFDRDRLLQSVTKKAGPDTIATTTVQYDRAGRPTTTVDPVGGRTVQTFDAVGRTATVTGPRLGVTTYTYLPGTTTAASVKDPEGAVVTTAYDPGGRAVRTTDQLGRVTQLVLDRDGHATEERRPDGSVVKAEYDHNGYQTAMVTGLGFRYVMTNDPDGRVLSVEDPQGGVSSLSYDDAGRPVTSTDRRGTVTTTTYDTAGRTVTSKDPLGVVESVTRNAAGLVSATTDAYGATSTYTYDSSGNVTKVVDPAGERRATWDAAGRLVASVDPVGRVTTATWDGADRQTSRTLNGRTTTYGYDAAGNVTSVTNPLGKQSTYTYDRNNRLLTSRDPLGNTTAAVWDAAGQLTRTTDPTGVETSIAYDPMGRRAVVWDTLGASWVTTYDADGRPVKTTDPAQVTHTYTWSKVGNLLRDSWNGRFSLYYTWDAEGNLLTAEEPRKMTYTYDVRGRVTSATDALSRTTKTSYANGPQGPSVTTTLPSGATRSMTYDLAGRPVSAQDGAKSTTTYAYWPDSQLKQVTLPRGGTYQYGYNADGLLASVKDPMGKTATREYDAAGQLVKTTSAAGRQVTYAYDDAGRLTTMSGTAPLRPAVTRTFGYDAASRLTSARTTGDGPTLSLELGYSPRGLLVRSTDHVGATSIDYDLAGRPSTITGVSGRSVTYTYDSSGFPSTLRGAVNIDFTFGFDGQVTRRQLVSPASGVGYSYYNAAGELTRSGMFTTTSYTYTPDGLLAQEKVAGGPVRDHTYDAAGRLVSTKVTGSDGAVTEQTSTWDESSNRTSHTTVTASGPVTTTTTYDAADRPVSSSDGTSYTHDADGLRLAAGLVTYEYNAFGEQTRVASPAGVVTQGRDALGRLATRTSGTAVDRLGYLGTDHRPGSYAAAGRPARPVDIVQAPGLGPVGYADASTAQQAFANPHGDVVRVVSDASSGQKHLTAAYDSFGVPTSVSGTTALVPLGYQGGYTDPLTGQVDMGFRSYQPAEGRFTQPDTLVGHPGSPVSFNRYLYAYGSPLSWTDPTGHDPLLDGVGSALADLGGLVVQTLGDVVALLRQVVIPEIRAVHDWISRQARAAVEQVSGLIGREMAAMAFSTAADVVASGLCTAATGGAGALGCMVVGGGVGGAVYGALTCNGDQACMMREVATGAASGVAFHGLGKLLSPVTGALGGALSRRAGQVLGVGKRAAASRLSRSAAREGAESVGESAAREATQRATRSAVREGADAVEQRSARKTLEACSPNSFAAGTPVAMADGSSKPIEQVQVGDRVAAQDPSSGDESAQTVTAVPRTTAERDLYTVTTSDGHQVVATDQHPFWDVTDRRWVYTRDLTVGHELDTPSGTVTITRIEHRRQLLTAYNLSVDGPHTYRAGDSRILVHNCPSGDHGGRTFTSSDPYVADLANAIERAYPGHVVDVNRVVYGLDGKQLTDYDIVLKNAIIQVKKNSRGKGVTRQVITSMESSGLPVIGYSPGLGRHARRSIEKAGGLAVGSLDDLIELVKPDKVVRS